MILVTRFSDRLRTVRIKEVLSSLASAALSVAILSSLAVTPCRADDWQKIIDRSGGHDLGNEQDTQPGRAATASDAELFTHTDGEIVFSGGTFYPNNPKDDPDLKPLDDIPRIVAVDFGPGLSHAIVLIGHSSYYGNSGTYIAILDPQHRVLWSDHAPLIRTLPTVHMGVHDFASGLAYPGWVVNRWNLKAHRWTKLTSIGTPF
ncbi:hypothetical protein [Acidomonas methanolica]|uniref:Uncharacterized protein n=1 Tax=Acidomonas methanolica NBRC 104435 TaxID=1231351 RepID=A0A023D2V3_ACIMT|nr:hypothetical protein [Acidomonas methanolica]MBU2655785.1 hypothetical protein [Acidomonas methanolica]TCS19057.1 hypothetical protein EDC31_1603 [Acidomonas methanolica]GAJ28404.1 hypothetical protein Amme_022_002 [Acidomonas methanolica NBRC 104435]GBQ49813.1 hypothetical protein AA0498_1074 [Acidomonas methanolica]GEL00723.1 hypothetical protein AME01nite_32210 [Acidomonas methanolica NBRC 104435]